MTTKNFIGVTLWGAAGVPASNAAVGGFDDLTWVQLKGHQSLPVFGVSHSNIDVEDLSTGFASGVKGMGSGRDTTFTYHGDGADTGITNAITAADGDQGLFSLRIARGSGTDVGNGPAIETGDVVSYAQGYLHSHELNAGSGSSNQGGTINFKQNAVAIAGTVPA
mgnify:CR=1 FL=1